MPNEALAIAVATEWDAQRETLKFYTMHMVQSLTCLHMKYTFLTHFEFPLYALENKLTIVYHTLIDMTT